MTDNASVQSSPPSGVDAPLLRVLGSFEDLEAILARNSVGRIAFAVQDRVSVVPVHYVYEGGWIYGRTAAGGKLRGILRNRRIAFEVDEHTQLFEWRSIVVRGPLYLIDPSDGSTYSKAVSLIRRLVPAALTDSDPVPFRNQLFRIRAIEISGRSSEPTGGKRSLPEAENGVWDTGEAESDASLREFVERALAKLSLSPESNIRVDAFDGVIVLTGTAIDAAERRLVEAAVLGVPAVRAVVQQIETVSPSQQHPTPAEIAREALNQLPHAHSIPDPGIKVVVEHEWLRLEGVANSRNACEEAVRRLRGVKGSRGVIDKLRVMGPATA
jgi:nitroimidazol reductase NimA-like FMN-containing flavoprotein (pyridoxamine 5'-phosphate oxidase superfamily)